ncbi:hypothetical protein CJ030_MR2G026922 [Morella rubra]|uniref:Uncharacterized protein n=1 Tax=Morella rubra TaxID=262757 RepID=A0A6A1WFE3_9ROSI|nr:hypothetical protein CJ030_MR2G026922 [Morella rubra]
MSKLSLLRTAWTPIASCEPLRRFSTEAEQPPQDSAADRFLQTPHTGLAYGRLVGITRYTLKTDIVSMLEGCRLTVDDVKVEYNRSFAPMGMIVQFTSHNAFDQAFRMIARKGRLYRLEKALKTDIVNMLEGCRLTVDDVKVEYNRSFAPMGMIVQFTSHNAFDQAFRMIARKGRLYRLEKADRPLWDSLRPYNGQTVLLQGLPRNALPEDVERFLTGCEFEASSIDIVLRFMASTFGKSITDVFKEVLEWIDTFKC